jgi:hypothetical protein
VYGTILGAGVMSVVATCGGSVFQHFFRRTGEQIREVTVQAKPSAGRQATVRTRDTTRPERPGEAAADNATRVLRTVGRDPDRTRLLEPDPEWTHVPEPRLQGDAYSVAGTHGRRNRGRKRSAVAAVAVFVMAMAGITTYELISGNDLSGGRGTTVGSFVSGGEPETGPADPTPSGTDGDGQGGYEDAGSGDGSSPSPGTAPGDGQGQYTDPGPGRSDGATTGPAPEPSGSGGATEEPTPVPDDAATTAPEPTGTPSGAPGQDDGATTGTDTGQ